MRKTAAIFLIVVLMAVAIVMYMFWQREAETVTKGVLVTCPFAVATII